MRRPSAAPLHICSLAAFSSHTLRRKVEVWTRNFNRNRQFSSLPGKKAASLPAGSQEGKPARLRRMNVLQRDAPLSPPLPCSSSTDASACPAWKSVGISERRDEVFSASSSCRCSRAGRFRLLRRCRRHRGRQRGRAPAQSFSLIYPPQQLELFLPGQVFSSSKLLRPKHKRTPRRHFWKIKRGCWENTQTHPPRPQPGSHMIRAMLGILQRSKQSS